jgi:AcrR family transcriptional regulator
MMIAEIRLAVKFDVHFCSMKRKYDLKQRAERQAETRQRIVEAAVALHSTVGPARTTIAAIAGRAGVQRQTVYAHFPSEAELFRACSAHWAELHPFPGDGLWAGLEPPEERLRAALGSVYAWYEQVEEDVAVFRRDAELHPVDAEIIAEEDARLDRIATDLARDWPRRKAIRAAIGHALEFETWRSLVRRQGLARRQAIDAMSRFVSGA